MTGTSLPPVSRITAPFRTLQLTDVYPEVESEARMWSMMRIWAKHAWSVCWIQAYVDSKYQNRLWAQRKFFLGGGGSKFSSKLKVKNYHSMYFINGHTHLKTPWVDASKLVHFSFFLIDVAASPVCQQGEINMTAGVTSTWESPLCGRRVEHCHRGETDASMLCGRQLERVPA